MKTPILEYLATQPQGAFTEQVAKKIFNRRAPEWKETVPWSWQKNRCRCSMAIASTTSKLKWMKTKGLIVSRKVYVPGKGVRHIWSLNNGTLGLLRLPNVHQPGNEAVRTGHRPQDHQGSKVVAAHDLHCSAGREGKEVGIPS